MFKLQTLYKAKSELQSRTTDQEIVIEFSIKSKAIIDNNSMSDISRKITGALSDIQGFRPKPEN